MSTPLTPELLDASVRLLKVLDYTGVAMVEFKVDPKTGHWALIEVNGRFWGSLPLALAAGADFPLALFQMLVEGRTEFPKGYREGLRLPELGVGRRVAVGQPQHSRTDPTLTTRPLGGVVVEAVKNVALLRERSDTLAADDPGPAWHELAGLARRKWSALHGRLARRRMRSGPARRRSEAEATRPAPGPQGGSSSSARGTSAGARSPRPSPGGDSGSTPEFASAGYLPRPGRPSPEHARDAASALEVDL